MHIARQVLQIQQELNIPDYRMCDILAMSEAEFHAFMHRGHGELSVYQKIMLVAETGRPIEGEKE